MKRKIEEQPHNSKKGIFEFEILAALTQHG